MASSTPAASVASEAATSAAPALSVVVPVFEEAAVVDELVRRCVAAATATGRTFELLVVDDASGDATPDRLAALAAADPRVVHVRLPVNQGQFGATKAGLARARGALVAVLDGDLQDPPELLPRLVEAHDAAPAGDTTVVFGVKARRRDPLWFRLGRAGYQALQSLLGASLPSGAGSYSLFPLVLARRVAAVPLASANLAPVLCALGADARIVPYDKAARYDDRSRVGPVGLAREALGSLLLLSPAGARLLGDRAPRRAGWGPLLAGVLFSGTLLAFLGSRVADRVDNALHHLGFANDDWEWLWSGQELGRFVALLDPFGRDLFRPVAWAQYLVFPHLFGAHPQPIALFQLALGLTGSGLLALVFRRAGFGWPAALLVVVGGWTHAACMQSTQLLSLNEVTLSRTFAAALWLVFLAPTPPRARVWVPLFLLGALSHESFISSVPVLVLLVWLRDGVAGAWTLRLNRTVLALVAVWLGTYALRVVLYATAPHISHVLTAGALERNVLFFFRELGLAIAGSGAGGAERPPLLGLLLAAGIAALLLTGRVRAFVGATLAWAVLWEVLGGPGGSELLQVLAPVVTCVAVALLVQGRRAVRLLAFAAAFAAVTYAPFLLQRDYVSWYFLHFAIHGALLVAATLLPRSFEGPAWRTVPAAAALAVAAVLWLPELNTWVLFPDRLPARLVEEVGAQLQPERDGHTTVLFVELGGVERTQDGYIEMRSPWLPAIGSSFAWGPDGRSLDWMKPVPALDFSFPGRDFRTMVLEERHLRLACTRPDDVLVSVRETPLELPDSPGRTRPGWTVAPLRPTLAEPDAMPKALRAGTPEEARLVDELTREIGGDGARARETVAGLRSFCEARRRSDTRLADAHATSTLRLLHGLPGGARTGVAYDARFVLKALTPRGLEDQDGALLPPPWVAPAGGAPAPAPPTP